MTGLQTGSWPEAGLWEITPGKSASIRIGTANWTYDARRVLLKNSASSRPQGRDADYSLKWIPLRNAPNSIRRPRRVYGSNRTQKPICLLAEPFVSDRVAVQHKKYYALAAAVAASSLAALQTGRLVAFEVRIEAAEE